MLVLLSTQINELLYLTAQWYCRSDVNSRQLIINHDFTKMFIGTLNLNYATPRSKMHNYVVSQASCINGHCVHSGV